jgi:hypothetical protein
MKRRLLGPLVAAALLAGCGNSTTYTPAPPVRPDTAAVRKPAAQVHGDQVQLTVRTRQRFVDGTWTSGDRSGRLAIVRRLARGYVVSAPRPRRDPVRVQLRAFLPYLETTDVELTRRSGGVDVKARPAAPARSGTVVHVATTGDDEGDGSEQDPLRTIAAGVKAAGSGGVVVLADGDYPQFTDDDGSRSAPVTITSSRPRGARIAGADLGGSANLRFDSVVFSGMVILGDDGRPARDITITNSEATTDRKAVCFIMRGGSRDVTLAYNWVHGCDHGLTGPGPSDQSRRITIVGNRFEHFDLDGIQFVNWSDVTIDRNTIADMHDPAGKNHADGIQSIGGNRRVRITRNEISDSRHQLILVQDSLSGPARDVTVESNLLHGAGANALDAISVYGIRITGNTIWDSRGGIFVGIGKSGQPRANVIAGNIINRLYIDSDTRQPLRRDNVLGDVNGAQASGETLNRDPGFRGGSYVPTRGAVVARRWLPPTDLYAVPRRHGSPGAIDD